eukprot:5148980-Prymnesium_polylepis.3
MPRVGHIPHTITHKPVSASFTEAYAIPRASSRAHFGVAQNTTCDTEHFMRVSRPACPPHPVCMHHAMGGGPRIPTRSSLAGNPADRICGCAQVSINTAVGVTSNILNSSSH